MALRLCFSDGTLAGTDTATSSIPVSSGDSSPLDLPHALTSPQKPDPAWTTIVWASMPFSIRWSLTAVRFASARSTELSSSTSKAIGQATFSRVTRFQQACCFAHSVTFRMFSGESTITSCTASAPTVSASRNPGEIPCARQILSKLMDSFALSHIVSELGDRIGDNVCTVATLIPGLFCDELLNRFEHDHLSNSLPVVHLIEIVGASLPLASDERREVSEVLLRALADGIWFLTPHIQELGKVRLGEHLFLRVFEIEFPSISLSKTATGVLVLTPCALVEPLRLPEASIL